MSRTSRSVCHRFFGLQFLALLLASCLFVVPSGVEAQGYPTATVRIVPAYPAGGSIDFLARTIAENLSSRLKQPVIVESRPGANERVASRYLLTQPADGYTIMLIAVPHSTNPVLFPDLPYDTRRDFVPLILAADVTQVVAVRLESEIKSFAQLVAMAKAKPKEITFGTPGVATGNHLMMELLMQEAGIQLQHIPLRGIDQLASSVLGGHIEVGVFSVSPTVLGLVQSGAIRALGTPTKERSPIFPDTPTFAEQGYPGVIGETWFGFVMRAGTPREIIDRLNQEINEILQLPKVRESLAKAGMTPRGGSPEDFRRHIDEEMEKWSRVIKAAHITIQ
jgi:tripartite-type tricarboxylate transporter receptor subunit TctC